MKIRAWLAAGGLFYLGASAFLSHRFPPINPDEVIVAVSARNFYHGQGIRYSLCDDIFAPSAYALRDLSNQLSRKLYAGWAGLWALSRHPSVSRASAYVAGLGVLLAFYAWGAALRDSSFGLALAASFFLNPIFWMSSFVINEHVAMLAGMGLVLWLSTLDTLKFPRALPLSGLLAGLLFMVHPNIALFIPGWIVYVLAKHPARRRAWLMAHALSGWTIGALISFLSVDWPRFLLFQKTIYWGFSRPPLLTFPWTPVEWVRSFLSSLWNGPTYYFNPTVAPGWSWSLRFFWTALGLAAISAFLPRRQDGQENKAGWIGGLGLGLLLTLGLMILLTRRTEVFYAVLLFPFLAPLAVLGVLRTSRAHRFSRKIAAVLLSLSLLCLAAFMRKYHSLYKPYGRILSEVQALIPRRTCKVVGPAVLWFGLEDGHFRDIGALITSRYYTAGNWNLNRWLGRWEPDVFIADDHFRRIFRIPPADAAALGKAMGVPARLRGVVETGAAAGTLDIYDLNWTKT